MTDINFQRLQPPSTDLNFGESSPPVVYIDLDLVARLASMPMHAVIGAQIDNAVHRGPEVWSDSGWSATSVRSEIVSVPSQNSVKTESAASCRVIDATPLAMSTLAGWGELQHYPAYLASKLDLPRPATSSAVGSWASLSPRMRPGLKAVFEAGTPAAVHPAESWITLHRHRRPMPVVPIGALVPAVRWITFGFSLAIRHFRTADFPWEEGSRPGPGISPHPGDPVTPNPPRYIPSTTLQFVARQPATTTLRFGSRLVDATIIVPVRNVYMTVNTQSVVLEETGAAIDARNVQLSIDDTSWTWSWSADVAASFEDALTAPVDGLIPVMVTINGFSVSVLASLPVRDRSFAKSSLKISGQGRSAWLADPYAEKVSRSNASFLTAQQLMADVLTENGVSLGWDIDWQLTDWTIPADTWSHTGTAIEACQEIAAAAGGYIQSHPTSQQLQVLPRYPVLPWAWDSITPDIDLPEDVCILENTETIDKPRYNAVIVSGQAEGVRCHVTQSGSDGGRVAPMVIDSLITHIDAGRQRGGAVLADTGRQKIITLSLPILAETGPILPGKFIRYRESGKVHIGLTRGLVINSDFPRARQQIRVETHVF